MSLASCSVLVLELFFRSFMSVASAGVNTEAKEVASVQNERTRNIEYQTEKPETRMSKPETNSKSEISKGTKNCLNSKVARIMVSYFSIFEFVSNIVFRVSNFLLLHACLTTKYGCAFRAGLRLRPGYKNGAPDLGRNSK